MSTVIAVVLLVLIVIIALVTVVRAVRIVPQAQAGIVERFGRYHRTLYAGLNLVMPFIDRLRPLIDLREQVVSFPPQPVITKDNLVVGIDTVIYFQVTDARSATYEIANYTAAVEQLTVTTLRNVVGGMDLDMTLTSRDKINGELRRELDEATGKWGLRVSRVELKAIEPPASIQDSMEKQMRADRDKRAAILSAEGSKQSAILTAEGEKQAAVLRARGEAEALVVRAEADAKAQAVRAQGQASAIGTVFKAIHDGKPDQQLLAYQYMQMMPQIARGDANKVWIVPSEIGRALEGLGGFVNAAAAGAGVPGAAGVPGVPGVSAAAEAVADRVAADLIADTVEPVDAARVDAVGVDAVGVDAVGVDAVDVDAVGVGASAAVPSARVAPAGAAPAGLAPAGAAPTGAAPAGVAPAAGPPAGLAPPAGGGLGVRPAAEVAHNGAASAVPPEPLPPADSLDPPEPA